jgi:hypothetical protein
MANTAPPPDDVHQSNAKSIAKSSEHFENQDKIYFMKRICMAILRFSFILLPLICMCCLGYALLPHLMQAPLDLILDLNNGWVPQTSTPNNSKFDEH